VSVTSEYVENDADDEVETGGYSAFRSISKFGSVIIQNWFVLENASGNNLAGL